MIADFQIEKFCIENESDTYVEDPSLVPLVDLICSWQVMAFATLPDHVEAVLDGTAWDLVVSSLGQFVVFEGASSGT